MSLDISVRYNKNQIKIKNDKKNNLQEMSFILLVVALVGANTLGTECQNQDPSFILVFKYHYKLSIKTKS